jgi:hypothetical protein
VASWWSGTVELEMGSGLRPLFPLVPVAVLLAAADERIRKGMRRAGDGVSRAEQSIFAA